MNNLPTLYKKTSTGAIQTWRIDVEADAVGNGVIIATYGQQGGKLQSTRDVVSEGKNLGKVNATSPLGQAQLEAQAQWEKKQKRGYTTSVADAAEGVVDSAFVVGGIEPMLAKSYADHAAKIRFPAFTQPKLDGHRCIAMLRDGLWTLWSRTRKPITGVPHIINALTISGIGGEMTLDGELYNHDYRDRFEELTSFIKRTDPKPGHEAVQYHVYDVVEDAPFNDRLADLDSLRQNTDEPIVVVETFEVADEDAAMNAFAMFVDQGYEGAILRNYASPYVHKRSFDLQKVKTMADAEYEIVSVEEGRGKLAGKGIFVCKTVDGATFSVKMKGALDSLAVFLSHADDYTGKMLTVQYQGITNDNKVPRFPIGLRIREDV